MSHVLVTGGAQGIGLGISLAYLRQGARVMVADYDKEALAELPKGLMPYEIDLADPEAIIEFAAYVQREMATLHTLVNNAGIGYKTVPGQPDVLMWDRVLAVNLRAYYLMAQAFLPHLKEAKGAAIVQIASTRALQSEPHTEDYSASKGGVLALTHALAMSFVPYKVRVNAILPGWIAVENWQKKRVAKEPRFSEEDLKQHPSGRVGTPEDVARAVLFLADPQNDFINGTSLVVDGGMTAKMIYVE